MVYRFQIEGIKNSRSIIVGANITLILQSTSVWQVIYWAAEFPIGINPVNSLARTTSPGHTTRNWFLAQLGFSASEWPVSWFGTDDDRGYARKHTAGTSQCERGITDDYKIFGVLVVRGASLQIHFKTRYKEGAKIEKSWEINLPKFLFALRSNAERR